MKKVIKGIGIFLLCVLVVVGGYVAYVFLSYHRIADNAEAEVVNRIPDAEKAVALETPYSITSYNIGFGAYSDDYSFFMDGGKYSRAFSKEAEIKNTTGSIDLIKGYAPDFAFFQEVDFDGTRSYHVNQKEMVAEGFADMDYSYAINYDSPYLFYPILEPHGANKSGIETLSNFPVKSALRRSLPISTSVMKIVDLDRCYCISRVPVENGKELVLINVHLSAYTDDPSIVQNQIKMLTGDIEKEMRSGNYVVCGGDFNQDLLGNSPEIYKTKENNANWCKPFDNTLLPQGVSKAVDALTEEEKAALPPSCRNADIPYVKGETFITMVDGFLVSENVEVLSFETIDNAFLYSDHNPVRMEFKLKK